MNSDTWNEWLELKLLPNTKSHSVIQIDRASYHLELIPSTKWPIKSDLKQIMRDWLDLNNIPYSLSDTKEKLMYIINNYKHRFPQKLRCQ